jgi:hypothetical protein
MKKTILVLVAVFALCVSASAQRRSVPYAGIGVMSNFHNATGVGLSGGVRNYNRYSFISFGLSAELLGYAIPNPTAAQFGVFAVPEVGVAIGPSVFKVYPHSGFMFGFDSFSRGFHWGGKNGVALDFGRHITVDFSTYVPRYNFTAASYAVNVIWRFGI